MQNRVSANAKRPSDAAFCKSYSEIQSEGAAVAANPNDAALIRDHYGKIAELADGLAASGPSAVREPSRKVASLARESVSKGSLDPFKSAEGKSAVNALATYANARCEAP